MGRRTYSYIRINRLKSGLTQEELAFLAGLPSPSAVSRAERAAQLPTAHAMIAYSLIFGLSAPELLPNLHSDVEDAILAGARELRESLDQHSTKRAQRVCGLLDTLILRLTNPN